MKKLTIKAHNILLQKGKTVACAESCTGGMLSQQLTSLAGSSAYFLLGCVVYSNAAKSSILAIDSRLIKARGAVSETVCRAMAESCRRLAKADFGVGITGIAGPSGAVKGKPVGTVYIAVAGGKKTVCRRYCFKGNRTAVREQSCLRALAMLIAGLR
jgi:PncC family amidohydrolase